LFCLFFYIWCDTYIFYISTMILEVNAHISDSLKNFWWLPFSWALADFPIFFLPLFLLWVWLYYTFFNTSHRKHDKRVELMHIFYACLIGILISFIVKQFIDIERPIGYIESTEYLLLWKIPEKSFPSDHATVSFAFVTALLLSSYRRVGYIFLPFVIIMNIFRIVVWVHWPLDILAWSCVWILSWYIMIRRLKETKLVKKIDSAIIIIMKKLYLY